MLYVPLFKLDELLKCAKAVKRFANLEENDIQAWYSLAGAFFS